MNKSKRRNGADRNEDSEVPSSNEANDCVVDDVMDDDKDNGNY